MTHCVSIKICAISTFVIYYAINLIVCSENIAICDASNENALERQITVAKFHSIIPLKHHVLRRQKRNAQKGFRKRPPQQMQIPYGQYQKTSWQPQSFGQEVSRIPLQYPKTSLQPGSFEQAISDISSEYQKASWQPESFGQEVSIPKDGSDFPTQYVKVSWPPGSFEPEIPDISSEYEKTLSQSRLNFSDISSEHLKTLLEPGLFEQKLSQIPSDYQQRLKSYQVEYNPFEYRKSLRKLEPQQQAQTFLKQKLEEGPPKFLKEKRLMNSTIKPSGGFMRLSCPAIGNPMPNITWTRNEKKIQRPLGKVVYRKWSMEMEDVIPKESGTYKCVICNKYDCIEHEFNVQIISRLLSPPLISNDRFPENQTTLLNDNAHFECKVISDLEPFIRWIKYKIKNATKELIENTIKKIIEKSIENNIISNINFDSSNFIDIAPNNPDNPSVLVLENVTHADEGWYTCIASTSLGQAMATAYLDVVDASQQTNAKNGPGNETLNDDPSSKKLNNDSLSNNNGLILIAACIILLFLVTVCSLTLSMYFIWRKRRQTRLLKDQMQTVQRLIKKVIINNVVIDNGDEAMPTIDHHSSTMYLQIPVVTFENQIITMKSLPGDIELTNLVSDYEFPLDSGWEISRDQLTLGCTLGEGAFGRVLKGAVKGLTSGIEEVAVKTLKDSHTDDDVASLVCEMELMKLIGKHPNIINLLGSCSQNGPLWVIVEFAPYGSLKDFLKKSRTIAIVNPIAQLSSGYAVAETQSQLPVEKLISFAFQIACGMEYLSSKKKLPDKISVKQKHLIEAFNTTRPSLSAADVVKYQLTYARFTKKEKSSRDFVAKRATLA